MDITNGTIGLTMEDHGEIDADIENTLRKFFNLDIHWNFSIHRGGLFNTGANNTLIPLMSVHFWLTVPYTNLAVKHV